MKQEVVVAWVPHESNQKREKFLRIENMQLCAPKYTCIIPVHETILEIIQPKLIIAFGNSKVSPYNFLHRKFGGEEVYIPAGHGNWSIKGFESNVHSKPIFIAGLPHLSRYSPIGKSHVIELASSTNIRKLLDDSQPNFDRRCSSYFGSQFGVNKSRLINLFAQSNALFLLPRAVAIDSNVHWRTITKTYRGTIKR